MTDGLWALMGSFSAEWASAGVRGALLLSAAGAASLLLRRAPAALRHLVWLGASVGLLLLPLAGEIAPRWGVPLPSWASPVTIASAGSGDAVAAVTAGRADAVASGGVAVVAGRSGAADEAGVGSRGRTSSATAAGIAEGTTTPADGEGAAGTAGRTTALAAEALAATAAGRATAVEKDAIAGGGAANAAGASTRAGTSEAPASMDRGAAEGTGGAGVSGLFFLVWALGTLALLGSLARSLLAVRRLERASEPFPEGRVTREVARIAGLVGVTHPVTLLRGASDAMPLSWGIRRGRVLLPGGAERWHPERLRSVLLHELAHVRRRDCLSQVIAEVARAIHWLDPLAWLAVHRLRVEREHACDDRVLTAGAAPSVYATELLSLARGFQARPRHAQAAVAMAGVSSLESRLRAVLDERRRRTLSRARAGAVAALALAATLVLAGATPGEAGEARERAPAAAMTDLGGASGAAGEGAGPGEDAALRAAGVLDTDHGEEPTEPRRTAAAASGAGAFAVPPGTAAPVLLPQEVTCGLATDGWRSHTHNVNNDDHRLEWSRPGCTVAVRVEGEVEFSADFRDVARLGRDARVRIEEEEGRTERVLDITPGAGGRPEYRYRVDGDDRDFDATARAWYEAMLLQVFRKGGFMARERVEALLAAGGPQAVLDELELITSDHVFARYTEELLLRASLDDDRALALVERARVRVDSDHYLAGILEALAARDPLSDRVMGALIETSESLDSDHYRAGVLSRALQRGDLTREHRVALLRSAGGMDSDHYTASILEELGDRYALEPELRSDYLAAVSTIDSDHYRASVLSSLMRRNDLAAGELAVVLRAAGDIDSDHYVQSVLEQVAAAGLDDAPIRDAYFDVATRIDSDHYQAAALRALLDGRGVSEDLLRRVIGAVGSIDSDHSKSGLLVEIARDHRLEGATRDAYLRAMDTIESSHSRGQVADALLRQERSGGP